MSQLGGIWVVRILPTGGHVIEHRMLDWYDVLAKVKVARSRGWAVFVEQA